MTYGSERSEVQKLYDAEVMKRVKKGIDLLFEKYGPDWVDRVDMDTLDLRDGSACVLGQVYSGTYAGGCDGYDEGRQLLDIWDDDSIYGFSTADTFDEAAWDALQEAWEDALRPLKRLPL